MSQAANDLFLIVVNDGNGDQCGMTYAQRVEAAAYGIDQFRNACRNANNWRVKHDCPTASRAEIFAAASDIQEYYRTAIREEVAAKRAEMRAAQ